MAQFTGNATRLDPYKNWKLRLWDGQQVYSGSMVSGLLPPMEVVKHRSGGDPSTSVKSPGRNKYEPITLERGITQDSSFSSWAGLVSSYGSSLGSEVSLSNFRKDLVLEFYNEAGQLTITFRMSGSNISETQLRPPYGDYHHYLHPGGPHSIAEQLAEIFQIALERSRR